MNSLHQKLPGLNCQVNRTEQMTSQVNQIKKMTSPKLEYEFNVHHPSPIKPSKLPGTDFIKKFCRDAKKDWPLCKKIFFVTSNKWASFFTPRRKYAPKFLYQIYPRFFFFLCFFGGFVTIIINVSDQIKLARPHGSFISAYSAFGIVIPSIIISGNSKLRKFIQNSIKQCFSKNNSS